MSYARRQEYSRLAHAGTAAVASTAAALLGLALAGAGAATAAAVSLLAAVALGLHARQWLALAGRSRGGARSEAEVRRTLAVLQREGWRLRHSLPWPESGDIDSLAIAPTRVGFAIETKTRAYDDRHLARVGDQAAWLSCRRRQWCRCVVVPVVCLVRARGVQRLERNVLVVSIDRLIPVLRSAVGGVSRPADDLGMRRLFGQRNRFE
ncbi:MAG TPA: NERD domain-containing protein [Solirubrobacteraceae bacterium]|nr:NERD domain-containing protein [Solirubrobacteraceae bacterium]